MDKNAGVPVVTRRRFAGLVAGGAIAAAAMMGIVPSAGAQQATGNFKTTTAVNLRAGAGTSFQILAVVPAGTVLTTYGAEQGGFRNTQYNGRSGWVSSSFLAPVNSGSSDGPDPSQDFSRTAKVASATNFRYGASTQSSVIAVLAGGTVVNIGTQVVNGFRAVKSNGRLGWMIDTALVAGGGTTPPPAGGVASYITSPANFRMDPSYGNNVIRVLPAGTAVTTTGNVSGDFVQVTTPGDIGWVFRGLVAAGTAPGGSTTVSYRATASLNLRERANATSRLLGVIPSGAVFNGSTGSSNGYTSVTYRGVTGYVLTNYLVRV